MYANSESSVDSLRVETWIVQVVNMTSREVVVSNAPSRWQRVKRGTSARAVFWMFTYKCTWNARVALMHVGPGITLGVA